MTPEPFEVVIDATQDFCTPELANMAVYELTGLEASSVTLEELYARTCVLLSDLAYCDGLGAHDVAALTDLSGALHDCLAGVCMCSTYAVEALVFDVEAFQLASLGQYEWAVCDATGERDSVAVTHPLSIATLFSYASDIPPSLVSSFPSFPLESWTSVRLVWDSHALGVTFSGPDSLTSPRRHDMLLMPLLGVYDEAFGDLYQHTTITAGKFLALDEYLVATAHALFLVEYENPATYVDRHLDTYLDSLSALGFEHLDVSVKEVARALAPSWSASPAALLAAARAARQPHLV